MKLLYIFAALTISTTLFAQQSWLTVSEGGVSDLNKIAFATPDVAVAVGSDGLLMRTVDGGGTWLRVPMPQDVDLFDVAFPSPNVMVAVGEKHWGTAIVAISYDSGASWWLPNVSSLSLSSIASVCFVTPSVGYAVSVGSVLKTVDGGLTWTAKTVAPGTNHLTSVRFTDAQHGVVTGGTHDIVGFTMHTVDGGNTWTYDQDQYIEPIVTSRSIDAMNAWRIGGDFEYGAFLSATNDGGASWSQTVIPDMKFSLNDVLFTDAQHGFATGGTIMLQTADAGAHWSQTKVIASGYLTSFTLSPRGDVWAVGSFGRILKQSSPNAVGAGAGVPSFTMLPNYPNPVSSTTELRFSLSGASKANVSVYGIDGSKISTLVDGMLDAGNHAVTWNAVDASGNALLNGTYFVKLTVGEASVSRRLNVVR